MQRFKILEYGVNTFWAQMPLIFYIAYVAGGAMALHCIMFCALDSGSVGLVGSTLTEILVKCGNGGGGGGAVTYNGSPFHPGKNKIFSHVLELT